MWLSWVPLARGLPQGAVTVSADAVVISRLVWGRLPQASARVSGCQSTAFATGPLTARQPAAPSSGGVGRGRAGKTESQSFLKLDQK